ncbi:MAG TPA: carboxypeptidase-like regulatory domain-containing protein, partial [Vicinamibacterales bacterium]|nr:carboxypeptidase-like regulatory domain-containing protein [Vicinamibacterales bacterium]
MFNTRGAFIVAVAICLSTLTARAQINPGHLTGVVKDAQGAVLPGVTVTASSPALLGAQSVTSEAGGEYRFPNLPAGTYTLTFELSGFQTMKRENIVLATGQTLNVDSTLQLASLSETITVSGQAPVVDKQATAVGYVQTTAQLTGVPTSTDLWGALAQTPGVRMQGVDVGGSHKSQQSGYEAFGVVNQARVMTDGVDTTEGSGGAGFYQDYFAQNEVAVSAAGQDVSMNTPGASIISTIKSGGNNFSGIENFSYEPGKFVGNNVDGSTSARGFTGQPNLQF